MDIASAVESILFVTGEPVSTEKLKKILGRPKEEILEALQKLKSDYADRGLVIIEKDGNWQFGTNPNNTGLIEQMMKSEFTKELSRAALETLTIVAYKGPMTRAEVEYIRGVNSTFTLRNLLMRGLIERIDNPKDMRSYLYSVSFEFMKTLGITKLEELPQYEELKKKAEEVMAAFEVMETKSPSEDGVSTAEPAHETE